MLHDLIRLVSLASKLEAALDSISKGKPGACGTLTGLIQEVKTRSLTEARSCP